VKAARVLRCRFTITVSTLAALLLLEVAPSHAATVAIVRPANPPPAMTETLVRLHGELTSVGFATEFIDGPGGDGMRGRESRAWLEQLAAQRGVDAVVAIVGDVSPDSVEVWVIDKVTGKSVVRTVPFEPKAARASETLAIRAIELLRSSFLEIDLTGSEQRARHHAPPPAVVRFVEMEQLAQGNERFGVGVGAATIMSLDGVGAALLPTLRFDWALRSWLLVDVSLAGLGTRPTVATSTGSAQVDQAYGLVGGCYRFRAGERLRPFVGLAAGVLHTSVEGQADSPNQGQGRSAGQWSFLLDGSFGAWLQLRDRFFVSLAAHAQVAEPYLAIRFADAVVATSARPNLLLTLTVGAWL
jgi:hypothetical protein